MPVQHRKKNICRRWEYVSCFGAGGNEEGGIRFAYGTNGADDVKEMPVLEEAFEMGKAV